VSFLRPAKFWPQVVITIDGFQISGGCDSKMYLDVVALMAAKRPGATPKDVDTVYRMMVLLRSKDARAVARAQYYAGRLGFGLDVS